MFVTSNTDRRMPYSAWQEFVQDRDPRSIPDTDPLFALPTKLIQAIDNQAAGFWSKEERRFELDLGWYSGGMFLNRLRPRNIEYGLFPLEDEFNDGYMPKFEQVLTTIGPELLGKYTPKYFPDSTMKGNLNKKKLKETLSDIDSLGHKAQSSQLGYTGWLVVNNTFLKELNFLKDNAPPTVGQDGRFPRLRFGVSQENHEKYGTLDHRYGYWAPSNDSERTFDDQCQKFFHRWCLRALLSWDFPVPVLESGSQTESPYESGVHIFLPWYLLRHKTPELATLIQAKVAQQYSGPLGTWLKKGKGTKTLAYYERMFRIYVYFGLAICRRYRDRVSESPGCLDNAFMEYFGLLKDDDEEDKGVDSVSKTRQALQKVKLFYSKKTKKKTPSRVPKKKSRRGPGKWGW